jgi:hypothetical protein
MAHQINQPRLAPTVVGNWRKAGLAGMKKKRFNRKKQAALGLLRHGCINEKENIFSWAFMQPGIDFSSKSFSIKTIAVWKIL